jgi:hypothetical protein
MRAALSLLSLVFLGGSLLPGASTELSIGFVVVSIAVASSAVCVYFVEEYRRQQPALRPGDRRSRSWRREERSVHS